MCRGERRAYPTYLLSRSYRDEQGRPRKEALANLTGLPPGRSRRCGRHCRAAPLVDAEARWRWSGRCRTGT